MTEFLREKSDPPKNHDTQDYINCYRCDFDISTEEQQEAQSHCDIFRQSGEKTYNIFS